MARWREYFQKLLNVSGDIESKALENIQQRSINTALYEKPTMDEMVRAIKRLKDGNAPGGDGISLEVWKYGGSQFVQQTAPMDQNMGERSSTTSMEGCQQSDHLQKRDRTECCNYRGISLFFRSRQDLCSDPTEH